MINLIDTEEGAKKMTFASTLQNISAIETLLCEVKKEYSLTDELCDDIWIALNEAVSNAIKHGNNFNLTKNVHLFVQTKEDNYLCFTVKDEGEGFDFSSVPDPTNVDFIDKPNGRGVFLINKLSDKVTWKDRGTSVEMYFDLKKSNFYF
ncbi:MAG: ATP-binding protein [Bacteroidia bacterium]